MIIVILLLLAATLGYPYLSAAILRHRMLCRLEAVCHAAGYRLRRLRRPILLSRNRSGRYDLLIENRTEVLAVKLWSAYRRGTSLICEGGRVRERHTVSPPLRVNKDELPRSRDGRLLPVRRTRSPLHPNDRRTLTRILLIYPSYRSVSVSRDGGERVLSSGKDTVFDKLLFSPSSLQSYVEARGENSKARQDARKNGQNT